MAKTLKDLLLALLNATLILVALCLFLALSVVNRAHSLTATFAQNLQVLGPLQESVQQTGAELAAFRADLAGVRDQSRDLSTETLTRLQERAAEMESRLSEMQAAMIDLRHAPERLVDHAIQQAGDQAVQTAARIRGCVPPPTE
jgi:septal ring factor EnvC (AmiA/AmiB activator)